MATAYASFDAFTIRPVVLKPILGVLTQPPAWTRLEPQSLSGDPTPGIAARIADPLWMIGRQWQMGEFRGEDCGTPVSVRVAAETQALSALRTASGTLRELPPEATFEPEVEAEPWAPPALRDRAEAAVALIAALAPLGWGGEAQLLADCGFDLNAPDTLAQVPDATWRLIARRTPDAERAALALEAGTPVWLQNEPARVTDAAAGWLAWYRRNVSRRTGQADCWVAKRLEYRFELQAGEGAGARSLTAPCHLGGPVDWFSFDLAKGAGLGGTTPAPVQHHSTHVPAGRLAYAGMPSNRMWQFEDGLVNFGLAEVQPHDLARVVFLEYATICGNDWLVTPIDLPRGVLARVTAVSYRTTFDEEVTVTPARVQNGAQNGRGGFVLFATDGPDGPEPGFVIPPNGRPALEGEAREEVIFARDETANVVWAIERSIEGADGLAHDRTLSADPGDLPARPQNGADTAWTLEVRPPGNWVPIVPVPTGNTGGFVLRKGSFDGTDASRGRILAARPFDIHDEEIPREGLRLRRVPSLLRNEAGVICRWTARRATVGWGEGSSRLEYDALTGPA